MLPFCLIGVAKAFFSHASYRNSAIENIVKINFFAYKEVVLTFIGISTLNASNFNNQFCSSLKKKVSSEEEINWPSMSW